MGGRDYLRDCSSVSHRLLLPVCLGVVRISTLFGSRFFYDSVHTRTYVQYIYMNDMFHVYLCVCVYRVKSSSSSLFCRVCLGWAIFAQLGSDWSRRLMSSSLDQDALMVSFSSHWTIPLRTHRYT